MMASVAVGSSSHEAWSHGAERRERLTPSSFRMVLPREPKMVNNLLVVYMRSTMAKVDRNIGELYF